MPGTRLEDIPLDAPIPATEVMYLWYEPDGAWVSWDTYVRVAIFGRNAERRRSGGGAAQSPLFQEES